MGLKKSYVIIGVGHDKILCLLTRWVGGSKTDLQYAYVIFEWSLRDYVITKGEGSEKVQIKFQLDHELHHNICSFSIHT